MSARLRIAASAALLLATSAHAQWAAVPDVRPAHGRAELSGVWMPDAQPLPPGVHTVEGDQPFPRHMMNIAADLSPEDVPLRPEAAGILKERLSGGVPISPMAHCRPAGVPWINAMPLPYKIVQTRDLVLVLYEADTTFRQIFLDGRKPAADAVPRWMGYSTGRWEGDELVVETVGLTDQSWLDGMGHPHSEQLRVTERFRRRDARHLEIAVTLDDPVMYTGPVSYTIPLTAAAPGDLMEYFCTENERSSANY